MFAVHLGAFPMVRPIPEKGRARFLVHATYMERVMALQAVEFRNFVHFGFRPHEDEKLKRIRDLKGQR